MNESNLTLRQWLRVNSETIVAFVIGVFVTLAASSVTALFWVLFFTSWTAGT